MFTCFVIIVPVVILVLSFGYYFLYYHFLFKFFIIFISETHYVSAAFADFMLFRWINFFFRQCSVPDLGSRSRVAIFVGGGCWGNLRRVLGIWDGEGLRKGRSVHK